MSLVCVVCLDARQQQAAQALAHQLQYPLIFSLNDGLASESQYALLFEEKGLSLQRVNSTMNPVYIDFLAGSVGHRAQFGGGRRQLLSRAVGLHKHKSRQVLDLTAGLGQDSFILAHLGANVYAIERSPIMYALLDNAYERLITKKEEYKNHLAFSQVSAISFMQQLTKENKPQVIYYDPMYPDLGKSAKPKKEMIILRDLVGDDVDADDVLRQALQTATERVVVKRSRHAPVINNQSPSWVLHGERCRYDVYLV